MLQSLAVTAAAAGPPRTLRCDSAVGSVSDALLLCELKHSHICSALFCAVWRRRHWQDRPHEPEGWRAADQQPELERAYSSWFLEPMRLKRSVCREPVSAPQRGAPMDIGLSCFVRLCDDGRNLPGRLPGQDAVSFRVKL